MGDEEEGSGGGLAAESLLTWEGPSRREMEAGRLPQLGKRGWLASCQEGLPH